MLSSTLVSAWSHFRFCALSISVFPPCFLFLIVGPKTMLAKMMSVKIRPSNDLEQAAASMLFRSHRGHGLFFGHVLPYSNDPQIYARLHDGGSVLVVHGLPALLSRALPPSLPVRAQAPRAFSRRGPRVFSSRLGIEDVRRSYTLDRLDRSRPDRKGRSCPSCCVLAHRAGQADRILGRNVGTEVALTQGLCEDTDSRLR